VDFADPYLNEKNEPKKNEENDPISLMKVSVLLPVISIYRIGKGLEKIR